MKRPSKKDIKAAVDALIDKSPDAKGGAAAPGAEVGRLAAKKSSQRIRKQGI